jgi:serine/threonine protein kinase
MTRLPAVDTLIEAAQARTPIVPEADRDLVEGLIGKLKALHDSGSAGSPGATVELPSDHLSADTPSPAHPAAPPPEQTEEGYLFLAPPEAPGELGRLGGYRVLSVLGTGGMGVVFLAEDVQLRRRVALKAMRTTLAVNPSAHERFLHEARAMAAVRHDHVVTIHQVGEDRGVPFFAMELLEGEALHDRLKREAPLPAAEALRIAREAAEGLAAAHARGLVHRDVKPANLWLETPPGEPGVSAPGGHVGRVKVLDFGLARSAAGTEPHLTQTGAVVGTPAYMAPEQARGEVPDQRSDLFSLGCILYQMTTGRTPFTGPNTMAILTSLAVDRPPAPEELNPALPSGLSELIMRLLAKDPAGRRRPGQWPRSCRTSSAACGRTRRLHLEPRRCPGPPPPLLRWPRLVGGPAGASGCWPPWRPLASSPAWPPRSSSSSATGKARR